MRLVVAAGEDLFDPVLEIRTRVISRLVAPTDHWGSGPHGWTFGVEALPAGEYEIRVRTADARRAAGCLPLRVSPGPAARARVAEGETVWPIRTDWTPALEDLYAVWVSRLFRVPVDFRGGWRRLHVVLRDPERNLLHDALGWSEDGALQDPEVDGPAVRARADCGDLPYALRAYFSWKMGLPFRFRRCLRGSAPSGAECYEERSNLSSRFAAVIDPVERFNRFLETDLVNGVHSATPRSLPDDEDSDFYPIEVDRGALRPGTVYVWPYGHLLVLTDVVDGGGPEGPVLMAVDGHGDGSVTVKRFGPRNFPYAPGLRTPGFKAFRPVRYDGVAIRPIGNDDLRNGAGPSPFSVDQYRFRGAEEFYRSVEEAIRAGSVGSTPLQAAAP